jgi:hypothetical protein
MLALHNGAASAKDLVTGVRAIERHTHYRARLEALVNAIGELSAA